MLGNYPDCTVKGYTHPFHVCVIQFKTAHSDSDNKSEKTLFFKNTKKIINNFY